MRPVSNEKRELIIEAKKRGENEKNIMKWIKNTSRSSIGKIWKLYRTTGSIQPKPYKGNNKKITKETEEKIRQTIKEKPDTTL
jgi:transposase